MESFIKADQVAEILKCSKSKAYKIMQQLNNELEKDGYITIGGRISRDYLYKRMGIRNKTGRSENDG